MACFLPRSLLRVRGCGARDFIHRICTQDVLKFPQDSSGSEGLLYSSFLTNTGRVICDAFISMEYTDVQQHRHETVCLDVGTDASSDLISHLRMLSALQPSISIDIADTSQKVVVSHTAEFPADVGGARHQRVFRDPRPPLRHFFRHYIDLTVRGNRCHGLEQQIIPHCVPCSSYHLERYTLGVAEGNEFGPRKEMFPLELNMDQLRAISFTKGCFLGQELTARTFNVGVTRKRIVPLFALQARHQIGSLPIGTKLYHISRGNSSPDAIKAIATVIQWHSEGQLGLCMIRPPELKTRTTSLPSFQYELCVERDISASSKRASERSTASPCMTANILKAQSPLWWQKPS